MISDTQIIDHELPIRIDGNKLKLDTCAIDASEAMLESLAEDVAKDPPRLLFF